MGQEHLIEISGHDHVLGRVALTRLKQRWLVELDIVYKESFKIYTFIERFESDEDEAASLAEGVSRMSAFLQGQGSTEL